MAKKKTSAKSSFYEVVFRGKMGPFLDNLGATWNVLAGSTDDAGSAASSSTSAWRSLGTFLGRAFGQALMVITLALGGLITH